MLLPGCLSALVIAAGSTTSVKAELDGTIFAFVIYKVSFIQHTFPVRFIDHCKVLKHVTALIF